MSRISEIMGEFRRNVLARESETIRRLTQSWLSVEGSLEAQITALVYETEDLRRSGKTVSVAALRRMERYQALLAQVKTATERYNQDVAATTSANQRTMTDLGQRQADTVLGAELGSVNITWNRLPVGATETMIGMTGNGTPLLKALQSSYPQTAAKITETLVNAVAQGWNPRKTARAIQDSMAGNLQHALTVARTEQLRAWRETQTQNYQANPDILDGWLWHSALDDRTCPICWGLHGSVHPLDEPMNDHVCGRCAPVPQPKRLSDVLERYGISGAGVPDARVNIPLGDDVLEGKTEAYQRGLLGPGRYELWRGGLSLREQIGFADDADYGPTPYLMPLKELR